MKSLAELQAIRDKAKSQVDMRKEVEGYSVVVGMATCGIAAGARPVMTTLLEEVQHRSLKNVSVTQTGCIGVCRLEPIVEVVQPDDTKVTYVKMNPEKMTKVVIDHLVNGKIVTEYTIGTAESEKAN